MKKTLKTLINAGLLVLFVSHSHGLVFNLTDINNQTGAGTTLLLDNTTPGFNGIDDTFDGSVTYYPDDNATLLGNAIQAL